VELTGHTILLTGGASGIGLALAERLARAGNDVVLTGRRKELLDRALQSVPSAHAIVSDVGDERARVRLAAELRERATPIDVLINNAGIQKRLDLTHLDPWQEAQEEIRINLEGPIHVTSLLLPLLLERPCAYVVNVSSGLAFVPSAAVPIYSATKAALHAYTLSLRHALRETSVRVIEVIPPAVRSQLGGSHDFGVPTGEYADSVIAGLVQNLDEIAYQFSARASRASRWELDAMFRELNR
jgi:uncharacterized oxidoreductase